MRTEPDWDEEYDRQGEAWPDGFPEEEPEDEDEAPQDPFDRALAAEKGEPS